MAKSHRIEIEDRDKQPNARAVIEWEIEQGNKGPRLSMTGAVSEIVDGRPSSSRTTSGGYSATFRMSRACATSGTAGT